MQVTVRGVVATTILARGAEVTVERTATIDDLTAKGYIEIVAEHPTTKAPRRRRSDG